MAIIVLFFMSLSSLAQAEPLPKNSTTVLADDSDLGGNKTHRRPAIIQGAELIPDRVEFLENRGNTAVIVYRERDGKRWPIAGLNFRPTGTEECAPGKNLSLRAELQAPRYAVNNGNTNYFVQAQVPCGSVAELTYVFDSPAGQALGIWQVAQLAETKLQAEANLLFWQRRVNFEFPADGDYYNWDTVHITEGHHWDVVGHELGHAIYDQADLGAFGGGSHAIDRCYSNALALSEGWATYFSAWLHLDPMDADAKFEYLVPRLAPLPLENIPANVCSGPTNEWRVAGFFWDLFDGSQDSEAAQFVFARTFQALQNKTVPGVQAAATALARSGIPLADISRAWELNFLAPYPVVP